MACAIAGRAVVWRPLDARAGEIGLDVHAAATEDTVSVQFM